MPVLDIAPLARHNGLTSLGLAHTTKEQLLAMQSWSPEMGDYGMPYFFFAAPKFSEEDIALIPPSGIISFQEADFSDFSALSMVNFEDRCALQLYDCENVDPSTLPKEPAIIQLTLERCGLTDLEFAREMPMIESLWLGGNEIRDLSPLADMLCLGSLDILGNPIADYTPLYGLKERLWRLTVDDNISQEQLAALQEALPNTIIEMDTF